MQRDSREARRILATILVAGIGAVVAQRWLEPTIRKLVKAR